MLDSSIKKIKLSILALGWYFLFAPYALGNLPPLLPMKFESGNLKHLYKLSLLDPVFSEITLSSREINKYQKELVTLKRKISISKKSKKAKFLKKQYLLSGRLFSHYYKNYVYETNRKKLTKFSLEKYKRNFIEAAYEYLRSFKPGKSKKRKYSVYYNIYSSSYIFNPNSPINMQKIKNVSKKLPPSLKLRVKYLMAYEGLKSNKSSDQSKSLLELLKISKALPESANVAIQLEIAKSIIKNPRLLSNQNITYARFLKSANSSTKRLPEKIKEATFNYSIALWMLKEKKSIVWNNPPFLIQNYPDFSLYHAIKERQAIESFSKGNYSNSVVKYKIAQNYYKKQILYLKFDLRILYINESIVKKTGNYAPYENNLRELFVKYQNENFLGKRNSKFVKSSNSLTQKKYLQLAVMAIDESAKNIPRISIAEATGISFRYLKTTKDKKYEIPLKSKLADVFYKKGDHIKAVKFYTNIYQMAPPKNKRTFIVKAIGSQKILASWPNQQPWLGIANQETKARKFLNILYNNLANIDKNNLSWNDAAHIGLLKMNLKSTPDAFNLWKNQINIKPSGIEASKATFLMMNYYRKNKLWNELVNIASIAKKKKIQPKLGSSKTNINRDLADGLYNGGKKEYISKNNPSSEKMFADFIKFFPKDFRIAEVIYLQSNNYKVTKNFAKSIENYRALVKNFPKSKYFSKAAREAFLLSIEMAFEETTMQIGKIYLKNYPNDSFSDTIKPWLLKIFMGRQLYNEASILLRQELTNRKNTPETKGKFAYEILKIEEAYGSLTKAQYASNQIKRLIPNNHSLVARALMFDGRQINTRINFKALLAIEKKIAALDIGQRNVADALAYVRFRIAEANAQKVKKTENNITLQNPEKEIDQHYRWFLDAKTFYDKVCEIGTTEYCAPSLFKMARLAGEAIKSIEKVTISKELSEDKVLGFNSKKKDIVGYLQDTAIWADTKSLETLKNGRTDPSWIQQILWSNTQDWNFDQVTGAGGLGYTQWNPSL